MAKAADATFIRTQADVFAWAYIAAKRLNEIGVFTDVDVEYLHEAAGKLLVAAKDDPKFIGDKIAQYEVENG